MKKLDKNSLDLVKENIKKLKEILPDIFTEDKIDFEKLKENLGEFIDESDEKYQFTWFGKKKANKIALTPTNATLRPDKKSSKNWDSTKNIYIEGDNLEVLKVLQKAYYKKVKVIYIDPPYNTGQNLIYKNDYTDNLRNYLKFTGQIDEEGNPLTSIPETSGRRHSEWLNMMYPRLKLARNLLKDDGFFITAIDHNELHNLLKICDEIFGEENRIGIIVTKSNPQGRGKINIDPTHEYHLVYAKNKDLINEIKLKKKNNSKAYGNFLRSGTNSRKHERPNRFYPMLIKNNKVFMIQDDEYKKIYTNGKFNDKYLSYLKNKYEKLGYKVIFPIAKNGEEKVWQRSFERVKNEYHTYVFENNQIKIPLDDYKTPTTLWIDDIYSNPAYGTNLLKELFDNKKIFDYSKSIFTVKDFLNFSRDKNDIILDFFSGSATTAHAVMELNAEDGGNRRFIMVQLPEPTDKKSEAYKAGYKNICEIGKERIRRAGEKIKKDYKDKEWIDKLDIGFKVFKLDSTNIKEWDSNPENLEKSLLDYGEFIKPDRSEEDLLYEVLLKYGIDLTTPTHEKEINGKKVYIVGFGSLVVYFDEIDIEIAKKIVNLMKEYDNDYSVLVLRDESFATSKDKVNIVEFFKQMNLFEKIITL